MVRGGSDGYSFIREGYQAVGHEGREAHECQEVLWREAAAADNSVLKKGRW
jgi:hypothetical protein